MLRCSAATAYLIGAKPAPRRDQFSADDAYIEIRDEQGRAWLWLVCDELIEESG